MPPLLEIRNLSVRFSAPGGEVAAVAGLDLNVPEGMSLGMVGESGAGKSQIFLAAMGLLARNGHASGSVRFRGTELLGAYASTRPAKPGNAFNSASVVTITASPVLGMTASREVPSP